jgi:translation elongation factor EF-G
VIESGAEFGNPSIDRRPVVDVIVHVTGASFKEPESTRVAFKEAAILAFTDAMKTAGPINLKGPKT